MERGDLKHIAITGMGCISPIGMNVSENWIALLSGKHGIAPIRILESEHRHQLLAGEIHKDNRDLFALLRLNPSEAHTRTELLARLALEDLVGSINFDVKAPLKTGFINSTTVGGMDATERFYNDYLVSNKNRAYIPHHSTGFITLQLARTFGFRSFVTTMSTACSSAANAIMLGSRMIKAGLLDRVVVGGVDSLSKFTVNGFNSLRIYSENHCKPFDEHRNGLNLGEAAAFLLLESPKSLKMTDNKALAYVSGYGNSNDAFHQTASSDDGDGAFEAMRKALQIAGFEATEIDYINAHGTATPNNDLSEGRALLRLYGSADRIPAFSSTKSFTGHTLAAAGSVEAVFSVLALQNQVKLPNLNFDTPIASLGLKPLLTLENSAVARVMSNSLGFGGNCSTIIFSKS